MPQRAQSERKWYHQPQPQTRSIHAPSSPHTTEVSSKCDLTDHALYWMHNNRKHGLAAAGHPKPALKRGHRRSCVVGRHPMVRMRVDEHEGTVEALQASTKPQLMIEIQCAWHSLVYSRWMIPPQT